MTLPSPASVSSGLTTWLVLIPDSPAQQLSGHTREPEPVTLLRALEDRCYTWDPRWCFMCYCSGVSCGAPMEDVSHGIHGQVLHVGAQRLGVSHGGVGRCLLLFRRWADVHCGSRGRVLDVALIWCSSGLVVLCGSRGQVSRRGPSTPGAVKASSALGSAAGNYNPAIYR